MSDSDEIKTLKHEIHKLKNLNKVTVLTQIVGDYQILKPWLDYYLGMGVDQIIIAINDYNDLDLYNKVSCSIQNHERILLCKNSSILDKNPLDNANKQDLLSRYVSSGFALLADIDEFIQFPMSLKETVFQLIETDSEYAKGYFVDRVSTDGTLNPLETKQSIWKQYPLESPVTTVWGFNNITKIVLCRPYVRISTGHHGVLGNYRCWDKLSAVHHFKWRDTVVKHLQGRVDAHEKGNFRFEGGYYEAKKILKHISDSGGKLDLEKLGSKPSWIPY